MMMMNCLCGAADQQNAFMPYSQQQPWSDDTPQTGSEPAQVE